MKCRDKIWGVDRTCMCVDYSVGWWVFKNLGRETSVSGFYLYDFSVDTSWIWSNMISIHLYNKYLLTHDYVLIAY